MPALSELQPRSGAKQRVCTVVICAWVALRKMKKKWQSEVSAMDRAATDSANSWKSGEKTCAL